MVKISSSDFFSIHPLARKSIQGTFPYFSQQELSSNMSTTRLADNENPYGGEYCRYPNPYPLHLQNKYCNFLSMHCAYETGNNESTFISGENILFCNGSIEAIDILLRAFCEPNLDSLCLTSPTFSMLKHWAKTYDISVIDIPMLGDDYEILNVEKIINTNAKILFLCNPTSPIGNMLDFQSLMKIIENFKGIIAIDETYHEFSDSPSSVSLITRFPNLVIIRSFSKAWGLAGIRAGCIVAERSILNALNCIKPPFSFSAAAQASIEKSFKNLEKLKQTWKVIVNERERVRSVLNTLSCVDYVFPSVANFLLVRFRNHKAILENLFSSGFLVRNCDGEVSNTIRISIGTRSESNKLLKLLTTMS